MKERGPNIGVLMGGWNSEREVSLASGQNVLAALRAKGHQALGLTLAEPDDLLPALEQVEVVFNCLHGGVGEDGTVQALMDLIGMPYTGSGMLACALAMNKVQAKRAFQQVELHTPKFVLGVRHQDRSFEVWCKEVWATLSVPLVVKPLSEGSSVGVQIAEESDAFVKACRSVSRTYGPYLVEEYIFGKEITAGVLRLDEKNTALPLLELRPKRRFYDYEAKYTQGMTEFIVPATLDRALAKQVRAAAVAAHEALGCAGYSRVDFRVAEEGPPHVLEVNTSPGMTNTSDLPQVAAAAGIGFNDLVEQMLQTATTSLTKTKGLEIPSPLRA